MTTGSERQLAYKSRHPDRVRTAEYGWRQTERGQTYRVLSAAKQRAKAAGVPFDLVPDDLTIPALCPVLGLVLQRARGSGADNSPSLDRVKPALGYTKENVTIISKRANTLKGNCIDPNELCAVAEYVASHQSLVELCRQAQEF